MTTHTSFASFTNKFPLTKTLRFALIPHEKTKPHIHWDADNGGEIFSDDRALNESRAILKSALDTVIESLFDEALAEMRLSQPRIIEAFAMQDRLATSGDVVEKKKLSKELQEIYKALRKEVRAHITNFASDTHDGLSWNNLQGKEAVSILSARFQGDNEMLAHIARFAKRVTNLQDLMLNRTHYIGDDKYGDGKHGQIPTRVINDNLSRFGENVRLAQKMQSVNLLKGENTKMFESAYFDTTYTQSGISAYNAHIGLLNGAINEYNQTVKERSARLRQFKRLYNQIGTTHNSTYETVENDTGLLEMLCAVNTKAGVLHAQTREFFTWFFNTLNERDLEKIYISKRTITNLSQEILSDWQTLRSVRSIEKKGSYTTVQAVKDFFDSRGADIRSLTGNGMTWDAFIQSWRANTFSRIDGGAVTSALSECTKTEYVGLDVTKDAYAHACDALTQGKLTDKNRDSIVQPIRSFLESAVEVARLARMFEVHTGGRNGVDALTTISDEHKDALFYSKLDELMVFATEANITRVFNLVRNYLTSEEVRDKEVRVYFAPQFLGGWSKSQEKTKKGVILKNGSDVYLGVLAEALDLNSEKQMVATSTWHKMHYQTLDFKTLVGRAFVRDFGKKFSELPDSSAIKNAQELIKKQFLATYPELKDVLGTYEDKKTFRQACERALIRAFRMNFMPISERYIESLIEEGKLYLFKISNKDIANETTKNKNIHTILFQNLFSEKNTTSSPVNIRLNGEAKIMLRDPSIADHDKKRPKKRTNTKKYEHHRFTERQLTFHMPLTLNAAATGATDGTLTEELNSTVFNTPRAVIGIDRGEKHLLYYAVLDAGGKKIESGSLNEIGGHNYKELLAEREKERTQARKEWSKVGNITKLKEGYLSQVVRFITDKAFEHNAAIILENLKFRFMQKRGGKFERSVYQQFQKKLLEKLQLVVDKKTEDVTNAPQLVCMSKGTRSISLKDLKGQHGVVFFLDPSYTSATCPSCGWRKDLYMNFESIKQVQKFIKDKKVTLRYDKKNNDFLLAYTREDKVTTVTLRARVDRIRYNSVTHKTEHIAADDLVRAIKDVIHGGAQKGTHRGFDGAFAGLGVSGWEDGEDILSRVTLEDAATWKALVFYINRITSIRNQDNKEEGSASDYIQCPRCLFDSRAKDAMITNGDENGAYNIARKGMLALNHVRDAVGTDTKPDVYIKREDWDQHVFKNTI